MNYNKEEIIGTIVEYKNRYCSYYDLFIFVKHIKDCTDPDCTTYKIYSFTINEIHQTYFPNKFINNLLEKGYSNFYDDNDDYSSFKNYEYKKL